MLKGRPLSRASLAPTGEAANCGRAQVVGPLKIHCGSEPARDGAGSACINAECRTAIASKLGSHRRSCELRPGTSFMPAEDPLWERACSRRRRVSCINAECQTAIASKLGSHRRSEERRVGKECVSTCRSRWSPYH